MRDIAARAGGELRTNPAWTLGERPVTVHAQGGCGMGTVTTEFGEVRGFSRLFVMDAATFPTSVGVNPSHTIAAVAERNIEHFIEQELGLARKRPRPPTSAATREAVAIADDVGLGIHLGFAPLHHVDGPGPGVAQHYGTRVFGANDLDELRLHPARLPSATSHRPPWPDGRRRRIV